MTITCIHTITCRARVCFLTIVLHACSFANGYINTLRMGSAFCGQTKCLLRVRLCPASATFTSAHRIIIMLSPNVGIKSASASAFGLASSGTLLGPCLLPDRLNAQRYRDFLETVLPGLLQGVLLAVRQLLWTTKPQRTMRKMSDGG